MYTTSQTRSELHDVKFSVYLNYAVFIKSHLIYVYGVPKSASLSAASQLP